jgi:hypothetical protein
MVALYQSAAWNLFRAYWQLSLTLQPQLAAEIRRAYLDDLFAPLTDEQVSGTARAALIARLYQLLLLVQLREYRGVGEDG